MRNIIIPALCCGLTLALLLPGRLSADETTAALSFERAVALLKLQQTTPTQTQRPVCIYLGSRENSFHQQVLERPEVQAALKAVIFVQVSLTSDLPYPLTGAMAKGEDLANLLGAPAGSVLFLDPRGVLIPNLTTTHMTLGNDPKLFLDLLDYVVSGRYRQLSIQEHAVVRGTQQLWFSALERGRRPIPMTNMTKLEPPDITLVDAQTGASRRLQDLKRRIIVFSGAPQARSASVMLRELTQAFKDSGLKIALAAPVDARVLALKQTLKDLEIYYLDAQAIEFDPSSYFVGDESIGAEFIVRFEGYVPPPLIASVFKIPLAQGFELLDKDLPVGECAVRP